MEYSQHESSVIEKAKIMGHIEKNLNLDKIVKAVLRISYNLKPEEEKKHEYVYTNIECLCYIFNLFFPDVYTKKKVQIENVVGSPREKDNLMYDIIMSAFKESNLMENRDGPFFFFLAETINLGLGIADTLQLLLTGYVYARTRTHTEMHEIDIKVIRLKVFAPINKWFNKNNRVEEYAAEHNEREREARELKDAKRNHREPNVPKNKKQPERKNEIDENESNRVNIAEVIENFVLSINGKPTAEQPNPTPGHADPTPGHPNPT